VADRAPWLGAAESELRAVARELEVPPPRDHTAAVRQRLEERAAPGRPRWRAPVNRLRRRAPVSRPPRRAVLTALAVLAALAVVVIATPQGRAAISHVFRFDGVEVRQIPSQSPGQSPGQSQIPGQSPGQSQSQGPGQSQPATGSASLPGEQRMSLAQARRQVSFPILVPAVLGQPGQVLVSDGGRVVSLVYPRTRYGQVRMDEFAGQVDQIYFEKIVYLGNVTKVTVNGRKALWIKGPHELVYVRPDGTTAEAPPRLTTGNTLLWGTGRAALRLEGEFGAKTALAIARSAH
jgi:hypothetical protein